MSGQSILESIQLCGCKFILECSVTTCDEPWLAYFDLNTLRNRRDFPKCKVISMKDEKLPFNL